MSARTYFGLDGEVSISEETSVPDAVIDLSVISKHGPSAAVHLNEQQALDVENTLRRFRERRFDEGVAGLVRRNLARLR